MVNPVGQVLDDVENPQAVGLEGQMARQVQQGQMPRFNEQSIYAALQQEAAARKQREQGILAQMQKREQEYAAQPKTSNLEQAAMLMQAAGALSAPTRGGGTLESFGAAGTALSGPLMKQAQAERDRSEKLMQLQMAREKMGMEMSSGDISSADMLKLYQMQQASAKGGETFKLEDVDGRPVLVGSRGTIKPFDTSALGAAPEADERSAIPPEIRSMGPDAVKKYKERMGTKIADTIEASEAGAERARRIQPIFERAEAAYKDLARLKGIGNIQGSAIPRAIASTLGTEIEEKRQEYEQASAELQAFKSELLRGQGAVTDFERRLLASTLPSLTAVNAKPGLATLDFLRADLRSTIERPSKYRNRGAPEAGGAGESRAPAARPAGGDPLAAARDAIRKGAPRDAVIKRLKDNGIDTSGL
jgi:hypothetical protein